MRIEETVLFEDFERAREAAVALTDRYSDAENTPDRDQLWEQVARQTEAARALLAAWLEQPPQDTRNVSQLSEREP